MGKQIKIAVFTSIRSEYGLLTPLIEMIQKDDRFELQLLIAGAHLKEEYGMTVKQIEKDGFDTKFRFDFLVDDSIIALSKLQQQIGEHLSKHTPNLMVLMGDRFELMPVATACTVLNIPIAHISGGEITEGAQDNQIRHALTKLSHLHYAATNEYGENIESMGEETWRICVSGEPGLDLLKTMNFIPKKELYQELDLDLNKELIISTFHPETITNSITPAFIYKTMERIVNETNYQVLITATNFDHGGKEINEMLSADSSRLKSVKYVKSLGQIRYYSVLKCATLMLGNSSSGILEAQSFELPAVNVGFRQKGRTVNPNVIHTRIDVDDVMKGIQLAGQQDFRSSLKGKANIFGDGNASQRILDHIAAQRSEELLLKRTSFKK